MPTAEQRKIWHRNYYLRNKEYVNKYNGTKVVCELCGCTVQRSYLRVHQRITKKCLKAQAQAQEDQNEGQECNPSTLQEVRTNSPNEQSQEEVHENDPSILQEV